MVSLSQDPRRRTIQIVAAAVAVVVAVGITALLLFGGSDSPPAVRLSAPSASPTAAAAEDAPVEPADEAPIAPIDAPASSTVAAVLSSEIAISGTPGGADQQTLPNPQASGAPLVFLVIAQQDGWLEVQLPQRPNGSTGWVAARAVEISTTSFALVVTTETNTLDLYDGGVLVETYSVATGTGGTPSPKGRFALTELLAPTNEGYGPFAYGTTAFSDALNSFGGGPGQIGLHGTDDEASLGSDSSHGCIRMNNDDISELAARLPLGTPIQIR